MHGIILKDISKQIQIWSTIMDHGSSCINHKVSPKPIDIAYMLATLAWIQTTSVISMNFTW